ncbi:MAG TPA: DUF4432 family protein, partial [Pirellulales bacterium]|nr:DUF4432 family protein [Pirellulales bacterium]
QVYCLEPLADQGRGTVILENAAADRAVTMRWSIDSLPYLTLWKNTAATEDGYVTGLEPGTGFPYNRRIERLAGRVPKLAPNGSREFRIDVGIHVGKGQVADQAATIEKLQGKAPLSVSTEPPRPAESAR